MALSTRICLLALCVLLFPVVGAMGATQRSLPTVQNPARIAGAVPLRAVPRPKVKRSTLGQRAVRLAAAEIGVPYRYGGSSPSGFDCSGLVAYVYAKLGIQLPHIAAAHYW